MGHEQRPPRGLYEQQVGGGGGREGDGGEGGGKGGRGAEVLLDPWVLEKVCNGRASWHALVYVRKQDQRGALASHVVGFPATLTLQRAAAMKLLAFSLKVEGYSTCLYMMCS